MAEIMAAMTTIKTKDKVLIIEDEPDTSELIQICLNKEGYETYAATDGMIGIREFHSRRPDLVILDIMLPKLDGWEICRRIREMSDVPIIVLSAQVRETDRVRGLNLGADDYLIKPFATSELIARVKSVLRRYRMPAPEADEGYADGVLTIDYSRQLVYVKGREVMLSVKEFSLLTYLVKNAGRVLSHEQILDRVWGMDYDSYESVKQYISYLRHKIEEDPSKPQLIVTVRGVGYRYNKM